MHNQNRAEYKARLADPAVSAKLAAKAAQWNALTREVASRRAGLAASSPPDALTSPAEAAASLTLIEKLLTVNPDPSHLWNHRRELLLLPNKDDDESQPPSSTQDVSAADISASSTATTANFDLDQELRLTATCLQRNPKAYAAWFHRKWTVRHWLLLHSSSSSSSTTDEQRSLMLQTELSLCASFLDKDERNFHCWNYRRFVVAAILELPALAGCSDGSSSSSGSSVVVKLDGSWDVAGGGTDTVIGPQLAIGTNNSTEADAQQQQPPPPAASTDEVVRSEFEYTSQRIEKNFSNCSAFHYRSKLLDLVLDADLREEGISRRNEEGETYHTRLDMARGELEMIQSAVFTEPDDQTAWWYHRFVLAWARPASMSHWTDQDAAAEAIESYAEVVEKEKESIRELVDAEGGKCKWGLLALHMVLSELDALESISTDEDSRQAMREEANAYLDQLVVLDTDRETRYNSMRR